MSKHAIASQQKGQRDETLQVRLDEELVKLKRMLNIEDDLAVLWQPDAKKELAGEVKGKTIFLYEVDFDSALKTLKHELVDFMVSRAIEPYKEVTNSLISILNQQAYKKKEELVERFQRLV